MKSLSSTQVGIIYAIGAYLIWGLSPLYFKLLAFIPSDEILAHRVIWSTVMTAILVTLLKQWPEVFRICRSAKSLSMLSLTSLLIAFHWLLFIWAINSGQMLSASLGYFINPIVTMVLGLVFLNERLSMLQWFAVFWTIIGLSVKTWDMGGVPWLSLVLAISFGLYCLLRKKVKIKAISGFFIETLLALPAAIFYLLVVVQSEMEKLAVHSFELNLWLMFAGVVTALPLIFFGQATLRLPLCALNISQYLAPSLLFFLAVIIYDEPISMIDVFTFCFVWLGIIVFILERKIFHAKKKLTNQDKVLGIYSVIFCHYTLSLLLSL